MKDLDRVEYKNGRAYVKYIHKSGRLKGYIKREYGQIIICKNCEEKCFASNNHIKNGAGKFCSSKCATQLENNPKWKNGRKNTKGIFLSKAQIIPIKIVKGMFMNIV